MDIKTLLNTMIQIASVVAPLTSNKFDDMVLGALVALRDSPSLIDWLQNLLAGDPIPEGALATVSVPDKLQSELTAEGLDAGDIAQFGEYILLLLNFLRKRRGL